MSQTQQQIVTSGSILSITLFEQKLMRNFSAISNRLKKLQGLNDIQNKTRIVQKQLKFLTTKVDSIVDKIPKDGIALSKKDVINVCKDQIFDLFNNSQDKIKQTQLFKVIQEDIDKVKQQIKSTGRNSQLNSKQILTKSNSFTAGTMFLSQSKKSVQASKQVMNQVLTRQQNKYVNQIMTSDKQLNEFEKMKKDIQTLYDKIDSLILSIGKQSFVNKQINQFDKYQRDDNSKSQNRKRNKKSKSPNKIIQVDNQDIQQIQKLSSNMTENKLSKKGQLSIQLQRNQSKNKLQLSINKSKQQIIIKQDLIARKTLNQQFSQRIKIPNTLLNNKQDYSGVFVNAPSPNQKGSFSSTHQHFNKTGQLTKIQYIPQNKLLSKAQRSKSLKKLQRVQKKLRLDDIKDINNVLKEIQLRLQNKTNHDIVSEFIKQFEEKLEIVRITKDQSGQINDLRKMIYSMDNKLQSIITYLQTITTQDEALIVKKNWTCISCDKMIQKFNGKVGQHANWDSMQSKKMSPSKIGAFGQAGQLASKIKNLMDHSGQQ